MKKVLFLIHDLGQGGAEKVLVNLVNHMDRDKFDITVVSLFGGGVNERFLESHIKYRAFIPRSIPGNTHIMKLFSPRALHRLIVRGHYDVEVAYLEGPSARVISGCTDPSVKLVSWIHSRMSSTRQAARSFRSAGEAEECYGRFDRIVSVSETALSAFLVAIPYTGETAVLYNTNDSGRILRQARESVQPDLSEVFDTRLVSVGKLEKVKGYERLIRIIKRLRDNGYPIRLYLLGEGSEENKLRELTAKNRLEEVVSFLGYQTNPYKYVSKCDLFVCSSYSEGFSTAATESLIVGTPVVTTEVSGMREMLGDSEFGLITENDEEALYQGIKRLLDDPALLAHYRQKAAERGKAFSTENTVKAVEDMLLAL